MSPPNRIMLSDEDRWFDPQTATKWDGLDPDDVLYRTRHGGWVLGQSGSYRSVSHRRAAAWLVRNEHTVPAELLGGSQNLEI